MATLSDAEITERLAALPHWRRDGDQIRCGWRFDSFADAVRFVNQVAELAEAADHHPDIYISYRNVALSLSTHSAGGLTTKDFDLAAQIEDLK